MRGTRYAFVLLVPLIPWLQMRIDRTLEASASQEEVLYVWSGERIKRLAPGFDAVLADIYWLRTVQYFGGQRAFAKEQRFELLRPLVEITTTLDPRFEMAYRYGAIFLSEPRPVGAGDPDAGIAVLEKGCRANPRSWRLRQDLGYFQYLFKGDARRGAEVLIQASEIPGAPFWLKTLAASILASGNDRHTARQIWKQMYQQAEEGAIKDNALWHLQYLDGLDAADSLTGIALRFKNDKGRFPASLDELRTTGYVPFRVADPTGKPFAYDRATGKVSIAPDSKLYRPS